MSDVNRARLRTALVATISVLGLTASLPSLASPILIDFETYPNGTPIPNLTDITTEFASVGVSSFQSATFGGIRITQTPFLGSGVNTVHTGNNLQDPVDIIFTDPVSTASILALDIGDGGLVLEAYDDLGNLLDADQTLGGNYPAFGSGFSETLSVSAPGIARLHVRQITTATLDGFVFDDLAFAPVPEPATGFLVALGFLGLVTGRRVLLYRPVLHLDGGLTASDRQAGRSHM